MTNKDPLLNFEEFVRDKNSFELHFVGPLGVHPFGEIYRKQQWYQKCAEMHPRLRPMTEELHRMMRNRVEHEYLKVLYEAYKLMHPFAPSNWDLFA